MLRNETGIDPFERSLTIASYCHEVYRTNYLKKDTIAVFQHDRQLKTKQSNMAVKWLSYEMEKEDIHIQHVRNGGEKRVGRYSLDGYCEEYHTAYEFQGCFWHGNWCNVINANAKNIKPVFSTQAVRNVTQIEKQSTPSMGKQWSNFMRTPA